MHIPDGYLSPQTCGFFAVVMLPIWYKASRAVGKIVKSRYVPLLAIGASFSFLVMMFNIPVPDGTTAHAVGATIIAIILGPWAAVIAVSIALVIQALFFGDGGVLAIAVNCFNMAFVLPFVGYYVYRAIAGNAPLTAGRRAVAGGIGGYVGINAAALCTAIELGIQPDLFHTAAGVPLYAPFHLAQTIPAMLFAHLTVAGFAEFAATAGVIAYLQRANLPIMKINHANIPVSDEELAAKRLGWRWALIGLAIMIVLTPLGLLAPGGAFGEDAPQRPRPREVPPVRGPDRAEQVQQLLEPRRPRRLRLPQRRSPGDRLSAVRARRHRLHQRVPRGLHLDRPAPHRTTGAPRRRAGRSGGAEAKPPVTA